MKKQGISLIQQALNAESSTQKTFKSVEAAKKKKDSSEKRNNQIVAYLSDSELEAYKAIVDENLDSMAVYTRKLILREITAKK